MHKSPYLCNHIQDTTTKTSNKTAFGMKKERLERKGLYNPENEHDACGVGMVVNIHGNKSHELVDNALKVLENMRHRGAEGADG